MILPGFSAFLLACEDRLAGPRKAGDELGPQHPDVAMTLDSLVTLYYERGEYRKAEPLSVRAIAIYEEKRGPNHPALATSVETGPLSCASWAAKTKLKRSRNGPRRSAAGTLSRTLPGS